MKSINVRKATEFLKRLGFMEVVRGFRFKVGDHTYFVDIAATNGTLTAAVVSGSSTVDKVDELVGMFNLIYYWSQRVEGLAVFNIVSSVCSEAPTPDTIKEGSVRPGSHLNREAFEYIELKGTVTVDQLAGKLGLTKKAAGSWLSRWVHAGYLAHGEAKHAGMKGRPRATYIIGHKWWGEKVFASERDTPV